MKIQEHETAGAVIYKKNNGAYFVLLQYKKWDELEGWLMPKGHIEPGESPQEAAKRECVEETGYEDITIGDLIKTVKIEYPWSDGILQKKTIHWYLATLNSERMKEKNLDKDEKSSLVKQEWFEVHEALRVVKFDNDREVIKLAIELIKMTKRERVKISVAVFLFLIKKNELLLIKRSGTGWMDGYYSVPAGSIDGGEKLIKAVIREAKEEVDVEIEESDLTLVHTMHCLTHGEEWIGVFFAANKWTGNSKVNEPHKHSEVKWVPVNSLPANIIPYVKQAVDSYSKKIIYSEYQI